MHLQKVPSESAAQLKQGPANSTEKRSVAVACFTYCLQRQREVCRAEHICIARGSVLRRSLVNRNGINCISIALWVTAARHFQSLSQLRYLCVVTVGRRQALISRIAENQTP